MGSVTFRVAGEEDKNLYKNLFNMYQNELGLYCAEFQDVDANGYYDASSTDVFFRGDRSLMPLVIEYEGRIVGFAVITSAPYCPEGYDFCLQEFFIVGYYRGRGVAQAAAEALLSVMPGRYVAPVTDNNSRALKFFRQVFAPYGVEESAYEGGFTLISATVKSNA